MSKRSLIASTENFPIKPKHIDVSRHFFNAFGNDETEVSARWIVRFVQERGKEWTPFTYDEINAFYSQTYSNGFTFNRLVEAQMLPPDLTHAFAGHPDQQVSLGEGWIIKGNDGKYYFTDDFVTRCFQSSRAQELA